MKSNEQTNPKKTTTSITLNRIAYFLIAFNFGLSTISDLSVQYFFKDVLKLEPSHLSRINSFISVPWMIKPLFGLLTDVVPVLGYRRKFYIILSGIVSTLCWLILSLHTHSLLESVILLFVINSALSFSTVIGEAIVVELSQATVNSNGESSAKDYISLFFMCRYLGAFISAFLKGYLIDIMPLRHIFIIASVLPIFLVISGLLYKEKNQLISEIIQLTEIHNYQTFPNNNTQKRRFSLQHHELITSAAVMKRNHSLFEMSISFNESKVNSREHSLFSEFKDFVCRRDVYIPTLFIISLMSVPSYSDAFFYFITNDLKFTGKSLGYIAVISNLTGMLAIWIYKIYLSRFSFKSMIVGGSLIWFVFSFFGLILVLRYNVKYGINDFWLALVSDSLLTMIGEIISMPMLSLACQLCPKDLEGTVYSMFMSALNLGGILAGINGSILMEILGITIEDSKKLYLLIIISNLMVLVPLPILSLIDDKYFSVSKNKDKNKQHIHHDEEGAELNKIVLK